MRITIEIDEKSGSVTPDLAATNSDVQPVGQAAMAASSAPPAEVLALAAATGAINGGPAPTFAAASADSAPHPFISRGGTMTETGRTAAISAGSAKQGKPCS